MGGNALSFLSMTEKTPLLKAAVTDFGIQWLLWIVAAYFKTEKFYDLAGSSTFLLLTLQTLRWTGRYHVRQLIQSGCVATWAVRLGLFLFTRILQDGEDRRFSKVRGNPGLFWIYWTVQGAWVWMTLWPTMILNTTVKDKELEWKDYLGWALWGLGFAIEMAADYQKSAFKKNPANQGKWIASGLWGICRHPNYLGEILMWAGLFLPASSVMSGAQYWSAISPCFVAFLLTKVSGIPILERQAAKKWGHLSDFQKYKRNTAVLVPYIW